MPQISFVMPTKNHPDWLIEAIQSIKAQTLTDWELIVVDDHSDDQSTTKQLITGLNDDRIRYYTLPDKHGTGSAAARNFGNLLASAPIIAVADADDLYYPERAALTVQAFNDDQCDVFYADYDKWDWESNQLIEKKHPPQAFSMDLLRQQNFIPHSSSAYRHQLILDFPYNSFFRRSSDYDLWTRLACAGKRFVYSPQKVYKYRWHRANISQTTPGPVYDQLIWQSRGWLPKNQKTIREIVEGE